MKDLIIKFNALAREIKETAAIIQLHEGKDDPADVLLVQQLEQIQEIQVKQMLELLAQSNLDLEVVDAAIAASVNYLNALDGEKPISN